MESELDAEALLEQATLLGLITQNQAFEAKVDAEDGSVEALVSVLLRRGWMTSWQLDRLQKGDPTGFFFGGCKVIFHIAEGTFARVYRGERIQGRLPVAIKVLRQRFVIDSRAVQRFHNEAEAGMKLRHPNIVRILDVGEQYNRHFMVMEYVEGSNLRDFLKIRQHLSPTAALPLMIGLARGLKYAMDEGVTHRDIKGTNILISTNGTAKLVDFGLATIEGEEVKSGLQSQRTVDYSALERTCGSPKGDPRSDIYFLGCVYYQMLTGQLPMPEVESKDPLAKMLKRSFSAIIPLSDQRHAPDPELSRIVEKMMKVDLKARYQRMDEVLQDLEAYDAQSKGLAPAPAVVQPLELEEDIFELPPEVSYVESNPAVFEGEEDFEIMPYEHGAEKFEVKALHQKNVLCVEAQGDVQDAFRKTLSRMGYRVFLVADPERAAERYRESAPDAVIFDLDGLGAAALGSLLDMHEKAREEGRDLIAIVLLGPRQQAVRDRLPRDERRIVLSKPVKMKEIQQAISQLVPAV
jgi:CheY-like chemotaxis protein/tRNA A-37 threonylcarbamoyl transferase component Bud32